VIPADKHKNFYKNSQKNLTKGVDKSRGTCYDISVIDGGNPMDELINSLFSEVEIPIVNCPPGLEGAEVEYTDEALQVLGTVKNGKLVVDGVDVPEGATIQWGKGKWVINW
jgi:hypothetical protein